MVTEEQPNHLHVYSKRSMDALKQSLSIADGRSPVIKSILDHLPCAVAIWANNQIRGFLNSQAMLLLGVAEADLRRANWINRIDPRDRQSFSVFWNRLKKRKEALSNDYRFFKSDGKRIWVRDVSATYHNLRGEPEAIISTYTEISDLKGHSSGNPKPWSQETLEGLIGPVIHEVRNNLHAIRLEIDLLLLDFGAALQSDRLLESIDRVNRSLHDLREYLVSPEPHPSAANPKLILDDILQHMKHELERQGIKVNLTQLAMLPLVWIDSKQFRGALERVIDFCRVLLEKGGQLQIETGLKQIDGTDHVELVLTASSIASFDMEEKDIFRPFLRVNNRQIGLSMALASQILRRNQGNISFIKRDPRRGEISILLKPCLE